jgi:hypothetical protein
MALTPGSTWLLVPFIPVTLATVHVNVVPVGNIRAGGALVKGTVNAVPLQVDTFWFGIKGLGLTVTTKLKVELHVLGFVPEVAVIE